MLENNNKEWIKRKHYHDNCKQLTHDYIDNHKNSYKSYKPCWKNSCSNPFDTETSKIIENYCKSANVDCTCEPFDFATDFHSFSRPYCILCLNILRNKEDSEIIIGKRLVTERTPVKSILRFYESIKTQP